MTQAILETLETQPLGDRFGRAHAGQGRSTMQIWPGERVSTWRDLRRLRHQLRAVQRGGRARRALPVRRARRREPASSCARSTPSSGTATCPNVGPGQRYGFRVTGRLRPGARACDAIPRSCCSTPTARRSRATCAGRPSVFSYRFNDPSKRNTADSAKQMPKSVVINPYFDWDNDRPAAPALQRVADLRSPRARASRSATPRSRRRSAAPTPPSRTRRSSPT